MTAQYFSFILPFRKQVSVGYLQGDVTLSAIFDLQQENHPQSNLVKKAPIVSN